jgi:hypothetical protein
MPTARVDMQDVYNYLDMDTLHGLVHPQPIRLRQCIEQKITEGVNRAEGEEGQAGRQPDRQAEGQRQQSQKVLAHRWRNWSRLRCAGELRGVQCE